MASQAFLKAHQKPNAKQPGPSPAKRWQIVPWAQLSYRASPDAEWTVLDSSYALDNNRAFTVAGNVCDVRIDSSGIKVYQQLENYSPHVQGASNRSGERVRCGVEFPRLSNQAWRFREDTLAAGEGQTGQYVIVEWTCRNPPRITQAGASYVADTGDRAAADPAARLLELQKRANALPLGVWAQSITGSGDVQLVFRRKAGEGKDAKAWSFHNVCLFLHGHEEAHVPHGFSFQQSQAVVRAGLEELSTYYFWKTWLQKHNDSYKLLLPSPSVPEASTSLSLPMKPPVPSTSGNVASSAPPPTTAMNADQRAAKRRKLCEELQDNNDRLRAIQERNRELIEELGNIE